MSTIIGYHGDGTACYTKDCSLGHRTTSASAVEAQDFNAFVEAKEVETVKYIPIGYVSYDLERTSDIFDATVDGHEVTPKEPRGLAKTRAALKNSRGEKDNAVRLVNLDWKSCPPASDSDNIEIVGPKDGRPLVVNVRSGFPGLKVVSGNVVILMNSASGNRVTVGSGAKATLFAGPERKVSVTAEDGAVVDMYTEEGSRGYQSKEGNAIFNVHGVEPRMTLGWESRS